MTRLVIDPVTRIEGHLRIEAEVDGGVVRDAWASGTMFRGIEQILRGRDPRDAWVFTQRICNVCTMVHALASVRAVEDALGITPPPLAVIVRNLISAFQYLHDHVVHFYHLHALDWVDAAAALQGDPAEAATLGEGASGWYRNSEAEMAAVKERLAAFVGSGLLGPLANGYWGHEAYRLPPSADLLAVAHYLQALEWQREVVKAHAILGGKNPLLQTFLVGGVSIPVDPDSSAALNADRLAALRSIAERALRFVEEVYLPDLLTVAPFYTEWAALGEGTGNFLVHGDVPLDPSGDPASYAFPGGVILDRDLSSLDPFERDAVTEEVGRSWYEGDEGALPPLEEDTVPRYTGPTPPYERLDTEGTYTWIKAPRYDGRPMEVGPLARMLVAYASGVPRVRELADGVLDTLGVPANALFSTLGRTAARGIESLYLAELISPMIDQLADAMGEGDRRIHSGDWDPAGWPAEARGAGFQEAPRGTLGHWVRIRDGKIADYQCVVPTTWNASPRDSQGIPGPYEAALVGTPTADPSRPLEVMRTIHSFDPCIACAVHMVDTRRSPSGQIVEVP